MFLFVFLCACHDKNTTQGDVSALCCYLYSYSRCVWVVLLPLKLFQMCLGRVVTSTAIPDVSGSCCYLYSYSRCVWVVFLPLKLFRMCLGRVVTSTAIPDESGSCFCL